MLKMPMYGLLAASLLMPGALADGQTAGYDQPYRPQVHFSPQKNWTNDPNGLVYFHGEYHLFFQYNPFGDEWGHMSWGHAVSKDLLHWQELPVAIPEEGDTMIFTGSVVVDRENSSGFCAPKSECLVAVYTGHSKTPDGIRQAQDLAYSRDDGRTWTKYAGNPVLDLHLKNFRDPSVSWDDRARGWVMAVSLPTEHKVRFYGSKNLKEWTQLSDFGPTGDVAGEWECPDLLQIPSADGKEKIWALKVGLNPGAPQGGSGEQYFLGSFDGKSFTALDEPGAHGWTNYGKDDYCAISFNGLPAGEKPVLLGWMNNWQYASKLPTAPWRGQMSLPRRLSFIRDKDGLALKQEPVVAPLRKTGKTARVPYELDLQFPHPDAQSFGVRVYSDKDHWTEIGFDLASKQFYIDRTKSGAEIDEHFPVRTTAPIVDGRPYNLQLIVDRSSVEAYAQDGTIAMTSLIFAPSSPNTIKTLPAKSPVTTWNLDSIWKPLP
jgi:fructan beta-fructosidase